MPFLRQSYCCCPYSTQWRRTIRRSRSATWYTVELIAGQIDSAMQQIFVATPFIRQGKLRALGVSSLARSPVLPEIAPIADQGVPGFESYNWNGVVVPARTPAAIINRLHATIAAAIEDNRDYFIKQGQEPGGQGLEQYGAFLRSEIARYEKVARAANVAKQ
jgi:tripartite-type tricarboxylate transporter receptor subunit TctC